MQESVEALCGRGANVNARGVGTGDALAPGTRLEQFVIERFLGLGGLGVTYLARDESLGVWRALKEYLPDVWGVRRADGTVGPRVEAYAEDYSWGLDQFLREARILARLESRHIRHVVRVYQVFPAFGTAYMAIEYVDGRTLEAEVESEGPLSEERVRGLLGALTEGLSAVHAEGILHRDITPRNVMIRDDGTPVLIDFGAARQATGDRSGGCPSVSDAGVRAVGAVCDAAAPWFVGGAEVASRPVDGHLRVGRGGVLGDEPA